MSCVSTPARFLAFILSLFCAFISTAGSSVAAEKIETVDFAHGGTVDLRTMVKKTIRIPKSSADAVLTSVTSPDFDCGALIVSRTADAITLLLPGDADPRCSDELQLTSGNESMRIHIAATPGRVTNFVEVSGNPQPAIQVCPDWDCLNHTDPTLGRLPSGELAIWFAAGGDRSSSKPVVGRAVQKRGGNWILDDEPLLIPDEDPAFWDIARETPSIRWNAAASAWDMWYLGYRTGYHVDPAIGQMRSLNAEGTQWKRPTAPIYRPKKSAWDGTFLTSPGALLGSDNVWRLYYVGANTGSDAMMRVGVLVSTDGETWSSHSTKPVFEGIRGRWDYNILDPHVQFVGGRYVMWYSALAGQLQNNPPISIGVAVSEDGFKWKRLQDKPIIAPGKGWIERDVLDVEVLPMPDGSLLMTGYGHPVKGPNPAFPDFNPGRIGFWKSAR